MSNGIIPALLLAGACCIAQTPPTSVASPRPETPAAIHPFCMGLEVKKASPGALADVCTFAVTLSETYPNFVCEQTIRRKEAVTVAIQPVPTMSPDGMIAPVPTMASAPTALRDAGVVKATVTFSGGKEAYSDVTLNGRPTKQDFREMPGVMSMGEFGLHLN